MSRLAALQLKQQEIIAQQAQLRAQTRASREAGQQALDLFGAAERFADWAQRKHEDYARQLQDVQQGIEAQRPITTRAVGHNENIHKLFERMKQARKHGTRDHG